MSIIKNAALSLGMAAASVCGWSQESSGPTITGNMESTMQYLNDDTLIGANQPASQSLINSYMNVFYRQAGFKAGIRIESYLPSIQGYPNNFSGTGLGMRYVGYENALVDVTLGQFYEQFGAGTILRAYEDRALGYDNALDGMRVILRPLKGVSIKGVYGRNRYQFLDGKITNAEGLVRGIDGSIHLNQAIKYLNESKLDVTIAGSMVSKYQADDREELILPENVAAYGGRMDMRYGKFYMGAEYTHRDNDPSSDNEFIYNSGHAALINFGYSQKGLGILVSGKSVDNMSFRSDRNKDLQNVFINYLPSMNKTHTYNLVASLYPYVTQPLGEIAYQTEIVYTIPKGTTWGGKYGTTINANYSVAYQPLKHRSGFSESDSTRVMYKTNPFDMSDSLYWQDININVSRKFTPKFNIILNYYNLTLNNDVAKVADAKGMIRSNIGVIEAGYKITKKHSIRMEIQALFTQVDKGDWATLLVEYNLGSHLFFSVMDQYNYGNPNPDLQLHYLIGSFGYVNEATRVTLSYGRQRAGLFCVGGVCRFVPASNGLTVNFTQSF
jgi:hypothetical protein